MNNGRNVAITAAIACALSAPLAIGPASARADELGDLRANQEMLQQRIDQLAQAGNVGAGSYLSAPGGGPTTVQMMGGSFPRSFLIPGTDTSIRVGGEVREWVGYWITGGNPNEFHDTNPGSTGDLNNIPLSRSGAAASKGHSIFEQSPQQSKINVETRTPTAWGEARTFIEFDFASRPDGGRVFAISDNIFDRLRFAYGTLGGFLAGQANSNFSDSDAGLETISFGGLVGGPGHARIPQVRYTVPLAPWGVPGALSFAAERPESDAYLGTGGSVSGQNTTGAPLKNGAPDLTAAWYIPQPWGHVDFSAAVRPTVQVKDGIFVDRTFVGYAGHFSGDVKPRWFGWDKDYIVWNFNAGDAAGGFVNAGSGNGMVSLVSNYAALALKTQTQADLFVRIKPVRSYGGTIGYRHQFTPDIRANIGVGIFHEDINGLNGVVCRTGSGDIPGGKNGCGLNKELVNAAASVFWSPVAFVDVGLEYMWGHRLTVANQRGDENIVEGLFKVKF